MMGLLVWLHVPALLLSRQLPPEAEETRDVLHSMVGVEQSRHSVEEILVSVKVLFLLNQLQFELRAHGLVLERVVILNVVDQFLQKVTLVIRLKNVVVVGLLSALKVMLVAIQLMVEWLHVVFKIQNFNNIGFASLPSDLSLVTIRGILVSELWLLVFSIQVAMMVSPSWHSVFAHAPCSILALSLRVDSCFTARHEDLDGF